MRRRRDPNGVRQRGAVLVELTLVVPVLVTIVLGMFEIGMAWSASQTVVQGSRSGARTVSQLGTYAYSDQEALRAVLSSFGPDADRVRRVSIYLYDETQPNGVPASCGTPAAPTSGSGCNTYLQIDFDNVTDPDHFATSDTTCGSMASSAWCPTVRSNSQTTASLVGVEVEYAHEPVSGFFGLDDRILTQRIVMKVEPKTS